MTRSIAALLVLALLLPAAVLAEQVADGTSSMFGIVLDTSNPTPPDSDDQPDDGTDWFPDPVDNGLPVGFIPFDTGASDTSEASSPKEDQTPPPEETVPEDPPGTDPAPPHLFWGEVLGREAGTPQVVLDEQVIIDLQLVNDHLAAVHVDITLTDHITGAVLFQITSEDGFLVEAGTSEQVKLPFSITHEGVNVADIEISQRGGESQFLAVEFEGVRVSGQSEQVSPVAIQSDSLPYGLLAAVLGVVAVAFVTTRIHNRAPAAPKEKDPYYARFDLLDLD